MFPLFKAIFKYFVVSVWIFLGFAVFWSVAYAQGAAQAFAQVGKGGTTGTQSMVWTAQVPNLQNNWRASPVAVCTDFLPDCNANAGFVETGYAKGTLPVNPNQLQVYVAWKSVDGIIFNRFPNILLNDDTWYTFVVRSQSARTRWVMKLNGDITWILPYSEINFTAGRIVSCGTEAALANTQMAVECRDMKYFYNGSWVLFNFTNTQITGPYCVIKTQQDFGAIAYGPNC